MSSATLILRLALHEQLDSWTGITSLNHLLTVCLWVSSPPAAGPKLET